VVQLLLRAFRTRSMAAVAAFLFLWMFNPFYVDVQYNHFTRVLGFSEEFYGTTLSLQSAGAVAGSLAYGLYCRRVPFAALLHASIVLGVASTLAYWLVVDEESAVVISPLVGAVYMTAVLVQLDLAARACPPAVAGTAFAALMSLSNAGTSLSNMVGAWAYDGLTAALGSGQMAYKVLVGVGACFTALCWLLIPQLRRCHLSPLDDQPAGASGGEAVGGGRRMC
jgi:hypothetical protein